MQFQCEATFSFDVFMDSLARAVYTVTSAKNDMSALPLAVCTSPGVYHLMQRAIAATLPPVNRYFALVPSGEHIKLEGRTYEIQGKLRNIPLVVDRAFEKTGPFVYLKHPTARAVRKPNSNDYTYIRADKPSDIYFFLEMV